MGYKKEEIEKSRIDFFRIGEFLRQCYLNSDFPSDGDLEVDFTDRYSNCYDCDPFDKMCKGFVKKKIKIQSETAQNSVLYPMCKGG